MHVCHCPGWKFLELGKYVGNLSLADLVDVLPFFEYGTELRKIHVENKWIHDFHRTSKGYFCWI